MRIGCRGQTYQNAECKLQKSKCPEGREMHEPDDLRTETAERKVLPKTTILYTCGTELADSGSGQSVKSASSADTLLLGSCPSCFRGLNIGCGG